MSVFIRKETKDGTYSYDFHLQGRRFSGSTERKTRREAAQIEKIRREEAKASLAVEKAFSDPSMTIEIATSRYWQEVGQHHKNWKTTEWSMAWLVSHFGKQTRLRDIDDSKIAMMVAKRRSEFIQGRKKPVRVSSVTVNRSTTQPLREILIRARELWGVPISKIKWRDHLLSEPRERVREASPGEEAAIMEQLERGYDDAIQFAFWSGCRRMEIIGLVWSRVDFFGRQFTVIGKGDKSRVIPMSQAIFDLLWRQQNNHPEHVFTYQAKRTVRIGTQLIVRGERYPMTESGLKTMMRRAVPNAGVKNFRFHDTRHTAATRVLRKSNLRVVQELLGHEDIKTTTKYAHALKEDVRDALNAIAPTKSPAKERKKADKALKKIGKAG
ncbi:site-specific integrase [Mesorhizobium sp. YR577]|uniref:tyrosine-type recombinase/integrase n=1 Tax=Mesorhizobium sp. YR577 TaxID=1884373 RepID=UPI0008DF91E7|nr:site-specific integrase [Mesorhizobium sp. YR577]SFU14165.1 Phage integrase family protein [Mesorhizobium sp. YR577]